MRITVKKIIPYPGYKKDLALKSGLSEPMVSMLLRKKRTMTLDHAKRLSRATGLSIEAWLLPNKYRNPFIKPGDRW
jgi:antitoxin component HigA of HigAB toxin-antitoxin module